MAAHELSVGTSDEYYTPRYVFDALGVWFDLDVAHPGADRWPTWAAPWWQAHAKQADLIMFVAEKIKFHRPDGSVAKQPGTGTTLWARGVNGVEALLNAERAGLGLTFTP